MHRLPLLIRVDPRVVFEGGQGGGLGPKTLCTKNHPTRISLLQISLFPTVVTLVWGAVRGGGGGSRGGYPHSSSGVRPFQYFPGGPLPKCVYHVICPTTSPMDIRRTVRRCPLSYPGVLVPLLHACPHFPRCPTLGAGSGFRLRPRLRDCGTVGSHPWGGLPWPWDLIQAVGLGPGRRTPPWSWDLTLHPACGSVRNSESLVVAGKHRSATTHHHNINTPTQHPQHTNATPSPSSGLSLLKTNWWFWGVLRILLEIFWKFS